MRKITGTNWMEQSPAGLMVAMLALGPGLLVQGIYVRRTAARLPEPEGPREGETGEGPHLRLLVLGDSAGAGVGAPSQDDALLGQVRGALSRSFRLQWKLAAKTGFTTRDAIQRLEEMQPEQFDVVAVSLGVNDITSGRMISGWLRELEELATLLRSKFQVRHIIIGGLPRMEEFPAFPRLLGWYMGARARQFNRALQGWAGAQPDRDVIPMDRRIEPGMMAEDGFHPGPRIYALWGAAVAEKILQRWINESSTHSPDRHAGTVPASSRHRV